MLRRSGQLTVDVDLVGRFEAGRSVVRADELEGDCQGATHFVYGAAVGAFDFHSGADVAVGAGAQIGGLGGGRSFGRRTPDGDEERRRGRLRESDGGRQGAD